MDIHHSTRHGVDFLLLVLILGLGLGGILYFNFDKAAQIAIVLIMSALYVFWGVYHHHHDNNLTGKIILEYTAMAILVAALLTMFLLRI